MTKITADISSYIKAGNIMVDKDQVLRPTPEQVKRITEFQEHLTDSFLNVEKAKKAFDTNKRKKV